MDLVLLFHCRRAIPLVLMFVLLSSLPALCSAEAVPVHFHNTGSSLLGSRLLVLVHVCVRAKESMQIVCANFMKCVNTVF